MNSVQNGKEGRALPKQFKGQHEDEIVMLMFRKHPVVMRKGLIFSMVGLLLGTVPSLINPVMSWLWLGLAGGLLLSVIIIFPYWISWYYTMFILTNERYIQMTQKGLFHRSVSDLSIKQVQSLNYQVAGLEQTVLGFGTIVMQTYLGDIVIHDIHHPEKTVSEISEILMEYGNLQEPTTVNELADE